MARQGSGFVSVVALIVLATLQQRQQTLGPAVLLQVGDLLLVVLINKGFYRSDGGVHRTSSEQGGQCAGQPTCQPPRTEQTAALLCRQPCFDELQMFSLGLTVRCGKAQQLGIASPSGHGRDAAVNEHRTGFTGMVRSKLTREVL
jgi:hypothetical protein